MDGYAFYDALLHSMQVNFDFWDNISEIGVATAIAS